MTDDAATVFAGYSIDLRRPSWWQWVLVVAFAWAPPIGWALLLVWSVEEVEEGETDG